MAVFASDAEFLSPPVPAWLAGLRGQLRQGGAGGPPELLGPVTAISELERVCEAMLAGRGGPHDDDRKSLASDVKTMRGALGPEIATELGPPLNLLVADVSPARLKTAQGARSIRLAVDVVRERLGAPAVRRAAWRDVASTWVRQSTTAPAAIASGRVTAPISSFGVRTRRHVEPTTTSSARRLPSNWPCVRCCMSAAA